MGKHFFMFASTRIGHFWIYDFGAFVDSGQSLWNSYLLWGVKRCFLVDSGVCLFYGFVCWVVDLYF